MNVVFDLGGVVIRWDPELIVSRYTDDPQLRRVLLDGIFKQPDWVELDRGTLPLDRALRRAAERTGLSLETITDAYAAVAPTMVPIEATLRIIERAKSAGARLYCLSNMHRTSIESLNRRFGITDMFDGSIISCYEKTVKPEPRIFQLLLKRYDLAADECVFVDDTKTNTDAARDLGFKTVHFRSPEQCTRELESMGAVDRR